MTWGTYTSYKESGVEWLGEIPEHWEESKLRTCLNPISIKNKADLPLLSVTREQGVILRDIEDKESNHNFIPDDLSGYKMVEKGQFAMNKMKAWQGSYGISEYTGIVSPAYFIFELNGIEPSFFHKAIRSSVYVPFFIQASDGVRIGQWDLSKSRMKEIPFYIPPKEEQTKIASFLDEKTTKIDEVISQKEKLIELLKERKQIVINEAVTKGLDKTVEFKESGVEWIGKIPKHWEILPGLRVFKENKRKNTGMIDDRVLSLSYGRIIVKAKEKLVGLVPESFETYQIVKAGDIIIRCTDLQNDKVSLRTALAKDDGIITSAYLNLNVKNGNSEYLHYLLHVLDITKAIYKFGSGLRQNLSFLDFRRMNLVLPPHQEQLQIVEYIETQTTKIDNAIELQQNYIAKLKEYKATLIDSVVTGKVRIAS